MKLKPRYVYTNGVSDYLYIGRVDDPFYPHMVINISDVEISAWINSFDKIMESEVGTVEEYIKNNPDKLKNILNAKIVYDKETSERVKMINDFMTHLKREDKLKRILK